MALSHEPSQPQSDNLDIPEGTPPDEAAVIRATYCYREEAFISKRDRMIQNRINFDTYNLRGDFSHKKRGQSREFLPRMALAVEQISSFFHQAMMDVGDWFSVEYAPGVDPKKKKIKAEEIQKLTKRQLEKIKFDEKLEDSLKLGLIGSLSLLKIHGEYVDRPTFYTQQEFDEPSGTIKARLYRHDKKAWQLKVDLIRQEDWYPDPTADELFRIQQIEMDYHKVYELASGPNAIYDMNVVKNITGGFEDYEQVARKARETAQNQTYTTYRKRVRIWEGWGDIIDPHSGELLYKRVHWAVANDRWLIMKPKPYPFWHGKDPYIATPIIRVPTSVWHKALMDAPTMLNVAMNELFNLQVDGAMMAAYGIRQLHTAWLADETKVSDGIMPGDTLEVNDLCPPGMKVLESVQTGATSNEVANMFNQLSSEFNQAAITNDLRMGAMPDRQVKATEVVEASQSITSMFTGINQVLETNLCVAALEKIWMTVAQNMDDLDSEEVEALLGPKRAAEIHAMSAEERFKETAQGFKFNAYGVSLVLNKMKDFKKITTLLQTIASNNMLMEEFLKKYDMGKTLGELINALDIDTRKIEVDPDEAAAMSGQSKGAQPGSAPPGPNAQSQIPQAAGMGGNGNPGGPQPNQGNGMPQPPAGAPLQ